MEFFYGFIVHADKKFPQFLIILFILDFHSNSTQYSAVLLYWLCD